MGKLRRIGVTSCLLPAEKDRSLFKGKELVYQERQLLEWLASKGDVVFPVPFLSSTKTMANYAKHLDGLVFHGGSDVAPLSYGEDPLSDEWQGERPRDLYELALFEAFREAGVPMLGVCRGVQLINVALGGTLYQDIDTQLRDVVKFSHRDAEIYDANMHMVEVCQGWLSAALSSSGPFEINSVHHQSVRKLANGCVVEAISPVDGVIEAIRLDSDQQFIYGVQWHPEWLSHDHPLSESVLNLFTNAMDQFIDQRSS